MNKDFFTLNILYRIKLLSVCGNMFDAERVIDDAFQSFFDIGNMGLLKVEMEKVGHGEMFDAVFYSRMNRAQSDKKEFYQFMLSFTPERLRKTRKFKEMDDKYSNITA